MTKENEGARAETGVTRKFDLEERLIDFSVRTLNLAEALPNTRTASHVAGQLIRCGTSAAPNYGEAQGAESRNDFIHEMKVCLKELRETRIWLLIIQRKPLIESADIVAPLVKECGELVAIFTASIATAAKNKGR